MQRRWNLATWIGFLIVVAAPVTYLTVFIRFPATRDFPWATLLLFAAGLAVTAVGVKRAYGTPHLYRGKVAGPVLLTLGAGLLAFYCYGIFFAARQLPRSARAPRVGDEAPDFTLPDADERPVTLSSLVGPEATGAGRPNGVVLIFYRGYW